MMVIPFLVDVCTRPEKFDRKLIFIPTVRPTVHNNPSQKRSFFKNNLKLEEFGVFVWWDGKHNQDRAFENQSISLTEFSSNKSNMTGDQLLRFQIHLKPSTVGPERKVIIGQCLRSILDNVI